MAIENTNPLTNSVIGPADGFSFDIDQTYTSLVVKVGASGGDEYAYDYALGGAQSGYVVTIEDIGIQDRVTVTRSSGWDKEPVAVTVVENESGSIVTTQFQFYLTSTVLYPDGMQPYNDAYEGTLIVTEEDVQVRGDVGWADFNGTDFDLVDLGNGKIRVNANETLKQVGGGGGGGGVSLGGIGKWTIQNVAGGGTPTGGGIVINSSDNTAVTILLMDTTTSEGQNYEQWLQTFDALNEGLTVTVYSEDGTKWFSSPVSGMSLGTPNYRNFTINHADKTNSGAHTWAVDDVVYIEVLPSQPDTGALTEPGTFGIGGFTFDDLYTSDPGSMSSSLFHLDNVDPSSATKMWIFYSPRQGYDLSSVFDNIAGSKITMHAQALTNGNFQATCGIPIRKGTGPYYYEIPISGVTDSGTNLVDQERYGCTVVTTASGGPVNGFTDMDAVNITLNEGTRTLTMTGTFDFYSGGVLYTKTTPSIVWPDSYSGLFVMFGTDGVLYLSGSVTPAMVKSQCIVGYLWWHQVDNETLGGFHNLMKHESTPVDYWFQELFNRGLEYNYGANLNYSIPNIDAAGNLDAHGEMGCYSGHFLLGGTKHEMASRLPTANVAKCKRLGSDSGGFYEQVDATTSGLVATHGTGRAGYSAANSMVECADDSYVWAHVFAHTGNDYDNGKYLHWIGLGNYTTKGAAESEVAAEVGVIMKFPQNEQGGMQAGMCPVASVLMHTKDTLTNAYKSRCVTLSSGEYYVPWWDTRIFPKQYSGLASLVGGPIATSLNDRYQPVSIAGVPGASNDQDEGYGPGSVWINTSLNDVYICCDASTGAAVWKIIAT